MSQRNLGDRSLQSVAYLHSSSSGLMSLNEPDRVGGDGSGRTCHMIIGQ